MSVQSIMRWALVGLSLSFAGLSLCATDAQPPSVKDRYEKREVAIPMRDGVKLFTIIYSPRDPSRTYPFLMTRTGYGIPPYGETRGYVTRIRGILAESTGAFFPLPKPPARHSTHAAARRRKAATRMAELRRAADERRQRLVGCTRRT